MSKIKAFCLLIRKPLYEIKLGMYGMYVHVTPPPPTLCANSYCTTAIILFIFNFIFLIAILFHLKIYIYYVLFHFKSLSASTFYFIVSLYSFLVNKSCRKIVKIFWFHLYIGSYACVRVHLCMCACVR